MFVVSTTGAWLHRVAVSAAAEPGAVHSLQVAGPPYLSQAQTYHAQSKSNMSSHSPASTNGRLSFAGQSLSGPVPFISRSQWLAWKFWEIYYDSIFNGMHWPLLIWKCNVLTAHLWIDLIFFI
jgi:hypothetical protein